MQSPPEQNEFTGNVGEMSLLEILEKTLAEETSGELRGPEPTPGQNLPLPLVPLAPPGSGLDTPRDGLATPVSNNMNVPTHPLNWDGPGGRPMGSVNENLTVENFPKGSPAAGGSMADRGRCCAPADVSGGHIAGLELLGIERNTEELSPEDSSQHLSGTGFLEVPGGVLCPHCQNPPMLTRPPTWKFRHSCWKVPSTTCAFVNSPGKRPDTQSKGGGPVPSRRNHELGPPLTNVSMGATPPLPVPQL